MQARLAMFLILIVSFAAIFSSVTFYVLSSKPSQSYFALAIYAKTGPHGYVDPRTNSTVSPVHSFNWTLAVSNRMGSSQFVMIIARIANSTLSSPNVTTPSTWFPEMATPTQFVGDGDTVYFNFVWVLENITQPSQTAPYFLGLLINGQGGVSAPVGAFSGLGFRWIFELWTYDLSCGNPLTNGCFHYGYGPQTSANGVWLQVWFNAQR